MDLNVIRDQIDRVDAQLVALLEERMDLVSQVTAYKSQTGKPVYDGQREEVLLAKIAKSVTNPDYESTLVATYQDILKQSRAYQTAKLGESKHD